ncbi:hypothetical protein HWE02_22990 [Pseudomonas oryzihabitans]|uniref:P-loop NTPase fold protein n=1 Tax=Pseudomonas oryzihabitans TaxID=47885 RepID=UPI0009C0E673|nr:hypothetical protein [Pseudomonas oryzihabitans]
MINDRSIFNIDYDLPLQPELAIADDKLSRVNFSEIATAVLRKVPCATGFVLSIEGPWGSGKSSVLSIMQAMLESKDLADKPILVHFNPWLIGDKDSLLRQFLSSIEKAVKLSDSSKQARRVAKEVKAYSKVFDLIKFVPGAEPWASLIKSAMEAAGDATGSIAEYKIPDIDERKRRVETALRALDCSVVVFIDDMDRLFPAEVFEMIRIVKAVGDLPRVGYVVAWDAEYIKSALSNLQVPQAESYLDKIVQVRMRLPSLSYSARTKLFDSAVSSLGSEAVKPIFEGGEKRLAYLYRYCLRELLEQPRDMSRVFNAVRMMEPLLRGEVVFSDILGLAAISIKAPILYELVRYKPQLFVGPLPGQEFLHRNSSKLLEDGSSERSCAYENSEAIRKVVHFLFPEVAHIEGGFSMGRRSYSEGVISHPSRLMVALQLGITDADVSIRTARQYLASPELRNDIVEALSPAVFDEFLEMLGKLGSTLPSDQVVGLLDICLSIARFIDLPAYVAQSLKQGKSFGGDAVDLALQQIKFLTSTSSAELQSSIYTALIKDPDALSCAAELMRTNFVSKERKYDSDLTVDPVYEKPAIDWFSKNCLNAVKRRKFFGLNHPGRLLWTLARLNSKACKKIFSLVESDDYELDEFAKFFLCRSWDSSKGDAYSLPEDRGVLLAYCSLETLKQHALRRVSDNALGFPVRASWLSVIEEKPIYGVDGSFVNR